MTRKRQAVPQLATILGIKFFQLVFSPWFVWDCNFSIYHATIMLTVSTKEKSHQGCLPFTWVKVWEYRKQNFALVNFVPLARLPFVQIVSIHRITSAKAWNGTKLKMTAKKRNANFCLDCSDRGNRTTFSDFPLLPEIFRWNPKILVPFSFHPDFLETFCSW